MTMPIRQNRAETFSARQVAALIWRPADAGVEVLLVTSRISGHWLLPKGWPIDGLSAAGAARQEAFEEAGARGHGGSSPVGSYAYGKVLKNGDTLPCTVDVFAIRAQALLPDWPEKAQRQRQWLTFSNAAARVMEPDLGRFLQQCNDRFSLTRRKAATLSGAPLRDRSTEPDATGEAAMLSPAQCRAARALVDWSPTRLAKESSVPLAQIRAFERGDSLDPDSMALLVRAFEDGGALMLGETGGRGAGVRLKFGRQTVKRIDVWENEGGPAGEDDVQ